MSADDVTLRPARPDDAAAVAEIWRQGWRDGHQGADHRGTGVAGALQAEAERLVACRADRGRVDPGPVPPVREARR